MTEQAQTCGVGYGLPQPCTHPAVVKWDGRVAMCEGHKALFELTPRTNELDASLAYLKRWIRTTERYSDAESLLERLVTIRDEFAAERAEIEAKVHEIEERYSLPPDGLEQLEAKNRDEEPVPASLPESEGGRRWRELDDRSSRLTAVVEDLEAEIDGLYSRLEDSVVSLLEREADKADAEAARVKEEFGL